MLDNSYRIRKTQETCRKAFLESKWYMSIFEINCEDTWSFTYLFGALNDNNSYCEYESGEVLIFNDILFDEYDEANAILIDKDLKNICMPIKNLFKFTDIDKTTVTFSNGDKAFLNDFSYNEENRFKIGELGNYFPW